MTIKAGKEVETGLALKTMATEMIIQDQAQYDLAAEFLIDIKTKMKEVEAAMDPSCKAAHAAWQVALEQKKTYLKPFQDAEIVVKETISTYLLEQKRISDAAAEVARLEAQKLEDKQKAALNRKADRLDAKGDEDAAADARFEAEMVFVPVVAPAHNVTKVAGVTSTENFDVEVINIKEFLPWLIENMNVESVVTIKTQPIKQYIKLTKAVKIPGIRIVKKMVISGKGR